MLLWVNANILLTFSRNPSAKITVIKEQKKANEKSYKSEDKEKTIKIGINYV